MKSNISHSVITTAPKQTNIRALALGAAFVALLVTGCSSTNGVARNKNEIDAQAVSALSFQPETRPAALGRWPLEWNMRVNETMNFVVPVSTIQASADLPTFGEDLEPGTAFVESAGANAQAYIVVP